MGIRLPAATLTLLSWAWAGEQGQGPGQGPAGRETLPDPLAGLGERELQAWNQRAPWVHGIAPKAPLVRPKGMGQCERLLCPGP